jgi:hypothetical protein
LRGGAIQHRPLFLEENMAEKKKSQEQGIKTPEELTPEEKMTTKEALQAESEQTDIIPSNPDSPHVKKVLESVGGEPETPEYVETYHWVKFHPRSSPNDEVRVKLTVNGECLLIERGAKVPLPHRFMECADHTTHEEYHQEPGEQRKIVTEVTTFPYELIGDSTKEEFERFKAEGTKATKEQLVKDGTMSEREAGMV